MRPHFRQALQCTPRGAHIGSNEPPGSLLWPPLSDLDLPGFRRFFYDRSPCRTDSLSRLLTALSAMLLPAAAIAAARQSGFELHEMEAA